jgi:putative Holliday junction resolvase
VSSLLKSAFDLPAGRLLALDLGRVRIGVAVSDAQGVLATPLTVVQRRSRAEDFAVLAEIVWRERVAGVLAGLPLDSQGKIGPQAEVARRYSGRLAARLPVPLAFWDESYSSVDAAALLRQAGGRVPIDAAAAAVILSSFLDARRARKTQGDTSHP